MMPPRLSNGIISIEPCHRQHTPNVNTFLLLQRGHLISEEYIQSLGRLRPYGLYQGLKSNDMCDDDDDYG